MLQGFNHNIKYRDIIFHIQTEDYGAKIAQIITHIFINGNIIASVKSSYNEVVNATEVKGVIKQMMETQHKKVLKDLVSGKYDAEIDNMVGNKKNYSDNDEVVKIVENQNQEFSPYLTEDKQKSIISKDKQSDNEESLDKLILSFLEKENK